MILYTDKQTKRKLLQQGFTLSLFTLMLTGCFHDDEKKSVIDSFKAETFDAVVATAASDYSSGAHSYISPQYIYETKINLDASASDLKAIAYGNAIYRLGKYGMDYVTKYDVNQPGKAIWQFSTNDENETVSSNPHDMVFVNENKAYITRFGSNKVWIVNPSATNETDFKIGELDLSAYADEDGLVEMSDATIVNDRLYIVMQRLVNYTPDSNTMAYIAVFDVNTDVEIDTNTNNDDLNGIALPVKNPGTIQFLENSNKFYLSAVGGYAQDWANPPKPAEYTGGIIEIDPSDYSTTLLIDDGDETNHPYGQIADLVILNETQGYFIGYVDGINDNLYTFNPTTGEINNSPLIKNQSLQTVKIDRDENLWVGNRTVHGFSIIDTRSNKILKSAANTQIDPIALDFFDNKTDITAVATTTAADYSSGAHALLSLQKNYATNNNLDPDASDIKVVAYKDYFYRLGKYGLDYVTKFHNSAPDKPIWQFSTMATNEVASSNPHDMVFVSSSKAYIIRYGSNQIWIVNPSAQNESEFKLGELDLSAYADDQDNIAEMTDALIVDGKLYVLMQRLANFAPSENLSAYVAVFDTATDTEISTGANSDGLNGIALNVKNPGTLQYLEQTNTLYVSAIGKFEVSWSEPPLPPEYTGGIETISLSDYSTHLLVDDGNANTHPYGQISDISIVNANLGYFIGYIDGVKDNLFTFNPTTGEVNNTPLLANISLSDINLDPANNLWVGDRTNHGVTIIDTSNNHIKQQLINTNIDPVNIVFVENQ